MEAGKRDLNPEMIDSTRLIDEVIGTARRLAEKNKNRLIVEAQVRNCQLARARAAGPPG